MSIRYRIAFAALVASVAPASAQKAVPVPDIELAGKAIVQGKDDDALRHLETAAKITPGLPPPRLMLARLQLANRGADNQKKGRENLDKAIAENPTAPEVYLTRAGIAEKDGRTKDAVADYALILKLVADPKRAANERQRMRLIAHSAFAKMAEGREDWAGVWLHNSEIARLDRTRVPPKTLEVTLDKIENPERALATFAAASANDPALESPAALMGRLYTAKGDKTRASEWFQRASREPPPGKE